MEQIIKKAQEGGYADYCYCNEFNMYECTSSFCHYAVVCDPLFWQALGKSCGWYRKEKYCDICGVKKPNKTCIQCGSYRYKLLDGEPMWKFHALRFHEINLTEGWEKAISYLSDLTTS